MSKIDKLSILGVRSFSNTQHETIQFQTPLTLIVGYNGSGKTTIIECLKYITTGQLPPNSKGGAFIHDPKLCGEKEVMAQVKLSFKGTNTSRLVVTRSLQLTVKKLARTMKTLEGSLLMVKDGERTTISSKVGDLDKIVPQYLGVSTAILDSVIFCHQDDSLWPMSEPSALKKKFDEIFQAQKYTKAIDNLKQLRKQQGVKLQELKIREENEKSNKTKGERVMMHATNLENEIDRLRAKEKELSDAMKSALGEAREKHIRANAASGLRDELRTKQSRLEYVQENIRALSEVEELAETDQWLENTLAKYEERMDQMRDQELSFKANYAGFQKRINESRTKLSAKYTEQGQHQAAKVAHEQSIEQRTQLVKHAAHRHGIRGYDGDLSESQVRDFVEQMRKASREKDRELDRLQKFNEDALREAQATVNEIEATRSSRIQDRVTAKQAITANEKHIATLQIQMDAIKTDEIAKANFEASQRDLQKEYEKSTAEFETADWDKQIHTENTRLIELESDFQKLRDDLVQSTRLASDRAQLDIKDKDLKTRQQSLDTLYSTYGSQLDTVLGSNWQKNALEREFQTTLDDKASDLAESKSQQDGMSRELATADFKLSSLIDSKKKKFAEVEDLRVKILASIEDEDGIPIISVEDFAEEYNKLQESYNDAQRAFDGYQYVSDFYRTCVGTAEKQDKCKLCDRKFNDGKERNSFVDRLNKKILVRAKDTLKADIEEIKKNLDRASEARSMCDSYAKISEVEIPVLNEDIARCERQREFLLARIDTQDALVKADSTAKASMDSLKKHVDLIVRYHAEILDLEADILRIATQQKISGNSLSAQEIEEQVTSTEEQIRALRNKISKMKDEKERARSHFKDLELELSRVRTKLDTAGFQLDKKNGYSTRIEELLQDIIQHRDLMQRADAELVALVPRLDKAKAQYNDVKERARSKEKELLADQKKLAETVHEFKVAEDSIHSYLNSSGPSKLLHCQNAIKNLESELENFNEELASLTSTLNELMKKINDSEGLKRSISDNLKLRSNVRDREALEKEIAALEERYSTDDHERLSNEAMRADKRYQELSAERGPVVGAMKSKDEDLARYLDEWETDYKDAAQNYREAHIKVETTKAAVEDLGQYGSALDAAIMKFHSLKMEEINRIAGELWQSTYQGTDIDTIMIRSENENTGTTSSTTRRNYNYRVCMVKQDAEMDMRGRCSAGQRVLASIIIRLALAECFGVNCGIIALDEPTTNLDQDNIKSLAESLHNIIKVRRQQQNFQLIVITHDEEFLKYMKCPEFADSYWRVSRDEKQKSTIEKQSVADIMG